MKLAAGLSLLLACCATAPPPPPPQYASLDELADAMTVFYIAPDETTFASMAMQVAAFDDELKRRGHIDTLLAVFFWRCVEKYGYSLPERATGRVVDRARLLIADASQDEWVAAVRHPEHMSPTLLDVSWMSYFATGDAVHLDGILTAATAPTAPDTIDLTASAAQWSFQANCRQHESVLAFAKHRRAESADATQTAFLDHCIQHAEDANQQRAPLDRTEASDPTHDTERDRPVPADEDFRETGSFHGSGEGITRELELAADGTFRLHVTNDRLGRSRLVSGSWTTERNGDYRWLHMTVEQIDGKPVAEAIPGKTSEAPMNLEGRFTADGIELAADSCRNLRRKK